MFLNVIILPIGDSCDSLSDSNLPCILSAAVIALLASASIFIDWFLSSDLATSPTINIVLHSASLVAIWPWVIPTVLLYGTLINGASPSLSEPHISCTSAGIWTILPLSSLNDLTINTCAFIFLSAGILVIKTKSPSCNPKSFILAGNITSCAIISLPSINFLIASLPPNLIANWDVILTVLFASSPIVPSDSERPIVPLVINLCLDWLTLLASISDNFFCTNGTNIAFSSIPAESFFINFLEFSPNTNSLIVFKSCSVISVFLFNIFCIGANTFFSCSFKAALIAFNALLTSPFWSSLAKDCRCVIICEGKCECFLGPPFNPFVDWSSSLTIPKLFESSPLKSSPTKCISFNLFSKATSSFTKSISTILSSAPTFAPDLDIAYTLVPGGDISANLSKIVFTFFLCKSLDTFSSVRGAETILANNIFSNKLSFLSVDNLLSVPKYWNLCPLPILRNSPKSSSNACPVSSVWYASESVTNINPSSTALSSSCLFLTFLNSPVSGFLYTSGTTTIASLVLGNIDLVLEKACLPLFIRSFSFIKLLWLPIRNCCASNLFIILCKSKPSINLFPLLFGVTLYFLYQKLPILTPLLFLSAPSSSLTLKYFFNWLLPPIIEPASLNILWCFSNICCCVSPFLPTNWYLPFIFLII